MIIKLVITAVCVTACMLLATRANIRITIKHEYPETPKPTEDIASVQEELNKAEQETQLPNYDEVLLAVQKILGGDDVE